MREPGRAIGFGAALKEQLRWFWQRMWLWIVIVAVLTSVASAWMISMMDGPESRFAVVLVGNAIHPLLVLIALSWAFSTWRDDPPKDRQYFWLHPVPRVEHTVVRSLAGGLWLMVVLAVIIAVVLVTMMLTQGDEAALGSVRFWFYVLGAIALAYIAASVFPVLSNRPGLWLIAGIALVILGGVLSGLPRMQWLEPIVRVFRGGSHSFGTALGAPGYEAARVMVATLPSDRPAPPGMAEHVQRIAEAEPGMALLIWLPIAIIVYLAGAYLSRPR